ncbi:MAG: rhomboid family intramembrane serine protease [Bacteroidota bacterium]
MNGIRLTEFVKHLIILNVVIYVGLMIAPDFVYDEYFSLSKSDALGWRPTTMIDGQEWFIEKYDGQLFRTTKTTDFNPIQIVTHFFTHSKTDIFHIIFNMFVLAMFGPICETVLGSKRFLRFYLFCGVVGGTMIAFLDPSTVPVVGASGAVSGVMVAFAMMFPREKIQLLFIPFGFEARKFMLAIGAFSAFMVVLDFLDISVGGNISHFGHLAGMLAALLYFNLEKYMPALKD